MFERFTDHARGAVADAQEEARGLGHDFIAPEHLLLGVVRRDPRLVLIGEAEVRALVLERHGTGLAGTPEAIPFTAESTGVLEAALALALEEGHVTPAHLLRALLAHEGPAEIVRRCGRPPEQVLAELEGLPADPADDAVIVAVDDEPLGDLGNPRVDARLLLAILHREGEVGAWLQERGVDETALRTRWLE